MFRKVKYVLSFIIILIFVCGSFVFAGSDNLNSQIAKDKISVNICFSIGTTCKPSWHLIRHSKRFQAAPLEWMRDCSLDVCLHLFQTKFSDFLEEIKEVKPWPGAECRTVLDTKNNILSMHHFSKDKSLEKEHGRVRKLMLRRAQKLNDIILKSKSIALIYGQDGESTDKSLIDFIKKFGEIYPNQKIYLLNVLNSDVEGIDSKVIFDEGNLKIIKFSFKDGGYWTGNDIGWDTVMKSIDVVKIK